MIVNYADLLVKFLQAFLAGMAIVFLLNGYYPEAVGLTAGLLVSIWLIGRNKKEANK